MGERMKMEKSKRGAPNTFFPDRKLRDIQESSDEFFESEYARIITPPEEQSDSFRALVATLEKNRRDEEFVSKNMMLYSRLGKKLMEDLKEIYQLRKSGHEKPEAGPWGDIDEKKIKRLLDAFPSEVKDTEIALFVCNRLIIDIQNQVQHGSLDVAAAINEQRNFLESCDLYSQERMRDAVSAVALCRADWIRDDAGLNLDHLSKKISEELAQEKSVIEEIQKVIPTDEMVVGVARSIDMLSARGLRKWKLNEKDWRRNVEILSLPVEKVFQELDPETRERIFN